MEALAVTGSVINLMAVRRLKQLHARPASQRKMRTVSAEKLDSESWQVWLAVLTLLLVGVEGESAHLSVWNNLSLRGFAFAIRIRADFPGQSRVKPIAEASGKLEHTLIGRQNQDIARGIENGRADLTIFQVPLHHFSGFRRKRIVEIIGDVVPNVLAIDSH